MMRSQGKNKILLLFFVSALLLSGVFFQSFAFPAAATDTVSVRTAPDDEYITQREIEHGINSVREDLTRLDERMKVFMWAVPIIVGLLVALFGLGGYFIRTGAREHTDIAKSYSDLAKENLELLKIRTQEAIEAIEKSREEATKHLEKIVQVKEKSENLLKEIEDRNIKNKKPEDYTQDDKRLLEEYRSVAEKKPERTALDYFLMALAEKDVDHQIELYTKAIELNPNYAEAFNNRGIAYDEKGDHDLAIKDYNEAIRLKPDYAEAFNNRGYAYLRKGEYDQAFRDYDEAIRLNPNYSLAFYNRACAFALRNREGDKELALKELRTAAEKGYSDYELAKTDPDLEPLRGMPEYEKILEIIRKNAEQIRANP